MMFADTFEAVYALLNNKIKSRKFYY